MEKGCELHTPAALAPQRARANRWIGARSGRGSEEKKIPSLPVPETESRPPSTMCWGDYLELRGRKWKGV